MVQKRKGNVRKGFRLPELNILLYLFVMLGVFPLFFLKQYEKIGTLKYTLFWYSSLIFLGISAAIIAVRGVMALAGGKGHPNIISVGGKRYYVLQLSFVDKVMLAYGVCVGLSFLFSEFKEFSLKGAEGWEMGLYAQLIFLGLYFVLSRYKIWIKPVLAVHFISSGLVFLLGILHRFDVDPLGMYTGLTILQKKEFLSTIGQATWYSSYVCTVFALGLLVFYFSESSRLQLGAGIYTVLSFGTLVTQNSDSAFLAIGAVMLLLGYFSLNQWERLVRFWQLMTFLWGTFGSMGILQRIFADRMIPLDSLSLFFSQSLFTWICFVLSLAVYVLLERTKEDRKERLLVAIKKGYLSFLILLAAAVGGMILFIFLNTKGYLLDWFGYQSTNSYLFFDDHWGNNRGSSWMLTWQQFLQLPLLHKLFGVGPDAFSAYLYSVEESRIFLQSLWGNLRLTNAHNEYLNHLFCYGLFGLTGWLTVLIGGVCYFFRKAKEKPYVIGFALCIAAYGCHNFFCYQQICCTPFLFILIGMGEGLTKWEKSPTIIRNNDSRKA
ncbi:MAG: O-antigen ligase family protein [Lachnospiraceae bacterium]|nr:O-antigen ligase family protein [Lachnospiraceae bacterium]MDD7050225.1 O-antigen ligase family protein [Lachnospiraceae bacterium]MDY3223920.1 O-antigen ligase family protein [Lachnospiraceae bacterium]MDY4098086.1 O-antigen ligase family protein [Lachnospiraceae bacterium]